jgi:hypothetical protein
MIDGQTAEQAPEPTPREMPAFLRRKPDAAVFGWFSHHSMLIIKGDEAIELTPDEVRALASFMRGCSVESQPL